jgi:type VI secretion system protein VasG
MQSCTKQEEEKPRPSPEELYSLIAPQLYKSFKPAFLGRLRTVPYYPIDDDSLVRIIVLKLQAIARRVRQNHQAAFTWDDNLVDAVYARCTEVDSGARNVDHILNGSLLPEVAERVLSYMSENKPITKIHVSAQKNGKFKYKVD